MIKALLIFACLGLAGALVYNFAALKVFNLLVSKDAGSTEVGGIQHYGAAADQTLYVYRPVAAQEDLPVLIFVHGGSWQEGDAADYEFAGRAFAAQGFVTVVINYRKDPKSPYPSFIEDVAKAAAWAGLHASEFCGDGSKLFFVGHSAGAYNISMAVLDRHFMADAGVDPSHIKAVATLAGPFDFLPLDSDVTKAVFGHVNDLQTTQPINFVRPDAPPFLILHGSADKTVYPRNAVSLYQHLIEKGAVAQRQEYTGLSHVRILLNLAKPLRSNAPVLKDVTDFFTEILNREKTN